MVLEKADTRKVSKSARRELHILTFDTQRQLVADRFTFGIDGAARVITARVSGDLLQDETLIRSDDTCARIVRDDETLQKERETKWGETQIGMNVKA